MESQSAVQNVTRLSIFPLDNFGKKLRNDGRALQFTPWAGGLHVTQSGMDSLQKSSKTHYVVNY